MREGSEGDRLGLREASNGLGLTLSCPPLPRAAEGELTRSAGVGELRLSEETDIVGESLADALHDTMVVAVPTGRGMNTGDRFGHGFAFTGAALLLERRIRSRSGARGDIANARRWSTGPQPHRGRHVEAAVGMQHQDLAEAVDTVMMPTAQQHDIARIMAAAVSPVTDVMTLTPRRRPATTRIPAMPVTGQHVTAHPTRNRPCRAPAMNNVWTLHQHCAEHRVTRDGLHGRPIQSDTFGRHPEPGRVRTCRCQVGQADRHNQLRSLTSVGDNGNTCPSAAIMPLMGRSKQNNIITTIGSLSPGGSTAGHIGAAWGMYMLSPNWSNIFSGNSQPGAYNDPLVSKNFVLMTDGLFNTSYLSGLSAGSSAATTESYRQFDAICSNMKANGINVYTIGFGLDDATAAAELSKCASSSSNFFPVANGTQLQAAFSQIVDKLNTLRLTK